MDEPVRPDPWDASLSARLDTWVADARIDGSADSRARERWLRTAAEADATFGGVLADLAERRATVTVAGAGGRVHHGRIEVIGRDFVSLRLAEDAEVLLALRAVASVRAAPRADPAVGERVLATELTLGDVLTELAVERTRALLVTIGGAGGVAGELRSVGQDVVSVRTDGDPAGLTYVRLDSIAEVVLR